MINLTMDGMAVQAEEGETILDAAAKNNIEIPTLCHHSALEPYGACRLCIVEIKQGERARMVTSCNYEIQEGLEVRTDSERVKASRKMTIELLLARCPEAEDLRRLADEYGIDAPRFPAEDDDCVLCGLCVRMCKERMAVGAADFVGRGTEMTVDTPYHKTSDVCMTCGACASVCPTGRVDLSEISRNKPVPIPFEYNQGLISRPPIYISFPQAIPNKASIDSRYCVHMRTDKCEICKESCGADAINYEQEDEHIELNVGSVIMAPGYETFNPDTRLEYGHWQYPNVVTALEFERILSATGPYTGEVKRPSDEEHPRRIAFIQCATSRDKQHDYCSSICCMYATKEAIIAKEHVKEDLDCHVYYMDLRAFGKGFEDYYVRAKELGVEYIRCRPSSIQEIENNRLEIRYISEEGKSLAEEYDMAVLSMGVGAPRALQDLSCKLGIELNEHGFCRTTTFRPTESNRDGVYVCGPFTEPKDIPETVTQASGAVSKALALLAGARGTLIQPREFPPEKDVSGLAPRIGIFVCHCGTNIGGIVDVPAVAAAARTLPDVIHVEDNLYTCSNDTQGKIKELIEEHQLNRVIVASCTPRTHEPLFRETIREAGLNPYLFEMANIRDQCSWVHQKEPAEATAKAIDLVRMAAAKSRRLVPLYSVAMPVNNGGLVIGGGISGMTAALDLAEQGYPVNLVERDAQLGGNLKHLHALIDGDDPQAALAACVKRTTAHPNIKVWLDAEIESVNGFVGNFTTTIRQNGSRTEVEHGAVVVATGAEQDKPTEYLYGQDERVITQIDLEARLADRDMPFSSGPVPKPKGKDQAAPPTPRVVMIQCVGSREGDRMYCSRVCCAQAVKNALRIKTEYPEADVYILYRELRTYGFREQYYTEARRKGVRFIRYDVDAKPVVFNDGPRLRIETRDPVLDRPLEIDADLLVLAPAIIPRADSGTVAQMLKIPLTREDFFLEAHMKLRPVDCSVDGVYLAGIAHAPKSVGESIIQAQAAAGRAATVISKSEYIPEAITAAVDEEVCVGCGICVSTCSYDAPEIIMKRGRSISAINKALCKGCGACGMACPSSAVQQLGFRPEQVADMISAALE